MKKRTVISASQELDAMTTLARRNSSINKIREYTLPKINLDDEYEVIHVMQEGWRGRLLLVEHRRTRHEVALKAIHKEATSKLEFFREFHYNYYLSPHTHILNAYDVAFQAGDYYIFAQEYAPFGDLTVNLFETGLGEANVKKIAPQIVSALEFMHSKDLVHRNINTDNILVFNIDFSEVKLCDFGSTRKNGSMIKRKIVSLPYAPPEIVDTVQNESFHVSTKQDVWQFGVLLYILLTGALPWQKADVTDPHYLEYIHWRKRKMLKTPKRFSNFTARLLRMFKRLLEPKPDKRASVREVYKYLEDKWLVRATKREENDLDNQSVCYSTFSIHSSKVDKDKVLHALKAHGIETTVDRIAKRKRIHEWIEKSVTSNLMFEENEPQNNNDLVQVNDISVVPGKNKDTLDTNIHNSGVVKSLETFHFGERRNSAHIVDGLKWEAGVVRNQENKHTHANEYNYGRGQLISSPNDPSKSQRFFEDKLPVVSNYSVKELSANLGYSPIRSSANVKRTSSFQEKSERQSSTKAETPCNNYKEMHSSKSHYHQSPPRHPLSSSKIHSKSQKLYTKSVSQPNSRTASNQNEILTQTEDPVKPKQAPKSPLLGRSHARRTKRSGGFQRSRSLARNHNYRFDVQKLVPEPSAAVELDSARTTTPPPQDSDDEDSRSDDSLTSVIPAAYYH